MSNKNTLGSRILLIRNGLGIKQQSVFASKIGIKRPATISEYENDKMEPSITVLRNIAELGNVSLDWLITGKGPKEKSSQYTYPVDNPPASPDEYAYIPLYNVQASAGGGSFVDQEKVQTLLAFRKDWIHNELLVNPKEIFLITVDGESMFPTLNPGDVVLVKKQNGLPVKDGIYVVRLEDVILVKRLQRLPGNKLEVASDNQAYKSFTLNLTETDNFAVIGRVIWAGRRF